MQWYWVTTGDDAEWWPAVYDKGAAGGWTNLDTWQDWDKGVTAFVKIMPPSPKQPVASIGERIDKLGALLTEAISIEASITGEDPDESWPERMSGNIALDVIERNLDRVLSKATIVLKQLRRIDERL